MYVWAVMAFLCCVGAFVPFQTSSTLIHQWSAYGTLTAAWAIYLDTLLQLLSVPAANARGLGWGRLNIPQFVWKRLVAWIIGFSALPVEALDFGWTITPIWQSLIAAIALILVWVIGNTLLEYFSQPGQ
jgi:hypothetical protein